jgi:hypothetical protein
MKDFTAEIIRLESRHRRSKQPETTEEKSAAINVFEGHCQFHF